MLRGIDAFSGSVGVCRGIQEQDVSAGDTVFACFARTCCGGFVCQMAVSTSDCERVEGQYMGVAVGCGLAMDLPLRG